MTERRPSRLESAVADYRRRLEALDASALTALEAAFSPGRETVLDTIEQLVAQIEQAGGTMSQGEAARLSRATELLRLIEAETVRLAQAAGQVIPEAQTSAIGQAIARAEALTLVQAPDAQAAANLARQWTAVNRGALETLVGQLSDGSPLTDWLQQLAGETTAQARNVLFDGITRGLSPRTIGNELARTTGMPLRRAQLGARTAMMDSYRSASLQTFAENADVLDGWSWSSHHGNRTCLSCLAKDDGTVYPLTVQFMASHPACRCSPLPVISDDDIPPIETGTEWFNKQPQATKDQMLPVGLRDDFKAGRVTLADMSTLQRDERFGDRFRQSTISEARANAKARKSGTRRTPTPAAPPAAVAPVRQDGPIGKPVGAAIVDKLPTKGANVGLAEGARDAISAIDRIHGSADMESVAISAGSNKSSLGVYSKVLRPGKGFTPDSIKISDRKTPRITTAHEIGHFIDDQWLSQLHGGPKSRLVGTAALDSPALEAWRQAVAGSRSYARLLELRKMADARQSVSVTRADGTVVSMRPSGQYIDYLLKSNEVFARSYSQYIATRANSPKWREELDHTRTVEYDAYQATQWDDDDFAPIAEAFDALFREIGARG
jgi:hypothetical protein